MGVGRELDSGNLCAPGLAVRGPRLPARDRAPGSGQALSPSPLRKGSVSGWPREALGFALKAVAWSLGLFAFLRVGWVETHGLLPLTRLQGRLAAGLLGTPTLPVEVTLACSGADVLALCLGAILAYPTSWPMRLAGASGGLGLILGLNTLRIGTLARVAASPTWFEALHVYLWPAVLILAGAGYAFAWMRFADRRRPLGVAAGPSGPSAAPPSPGHEPVRLTRRFVLLTMVLLLVFTAANSSLSHESASVLAVATFIAHAAAATLGLLGVQANTTTNVLWTSRGGFMVTQECISTPLIPIYLAAVLAFPTTWRRRTLGVLATGPIFVGLGIVRLLLVALPAALVSSPIFLVHAFYQLLLAAVIVFLAACWRHGAGGTALRRALLGVVSGLAFVYLLGSPYTRLVTRAAAVLGGTGPSGVAAGLSIEDPQGALALLPAFQVGLYLALWVAVFAALSWRRLLAGLALLGLIQTATFVALPVLASHTGLTPRVLDIRAWAVAGPLVVVALAWLFRRSTPGAAPVGGLSPG